MDLEDRLHWIYKFSNDVTVGIPNFQDYWEAEFEISFEKVFNLITNKEYK